VTAAIYRYEVPVDGQWHDLDLSGAIHHVACRGGADVVELWALCSGGPAVTRSLRVYGTGQPLPDHPVTYRGTALAADGALVWHLMERAAAADAPPARSARYPQVGEIWHPVDDLRDHVVITGVSGDTTTVVYTAPSDATRDRPDPQDSLAPRDDFVREFCPPDATYIPTSDWSGPWGDVARAFCPPDARYVPNTEDVHVVTDDSDDPEHVDDCPGCALPPGKKEGTDA
jgi:hypothetical protein